MIIEIGIWNSFFDLIIKTKNKKKIKTLFHFKAKIECPFWPTGWLPFSCLIDFYFEFLMSSFVFHFHKKMEKEIQYIFRFSFSWRNWKMKYLTRSRLTLWLLSRMVYTLFKRKFVPSPLRFAVVQGSRGHQESAV